MLLNTHYTHRPGNEAEIKYFHPCNRDPPAHRDIELTLNSLDS